MMTSNRQELNALLSKIGMAAFVRRVQAGDAQALRLAERSSGEIKRQHIAAWKANR